MTISIDRVLALSRQVLAGHEREMRVVGVVPSDGGVERIEVLPIIAGKGVDERVLLNLPRDDGSHFEDELRRKLEEVLRSSSGPQ